MFDGTLGVYPHKKIQIDIDPNAKPVHSRPYPVPQIYLKTFKPELNHLVRIGVLALQQESEWASLLRAKVAEILPFRIDKRLF
jgi:hypothetical protein